MAEEKVPIYGIDLAEAEIKGCMSWLDMEEGKTFKRILEALISAAESNSMKDFDEARNVSLSEKARERYLGERKGLQKISRLSETLRSQL